MRLKFKERKKISENLVRFLPQSVTYLHKITKFLNRIVLKSENSFLTPNFRGQMNNNSALTQIFGKSYVPMPAHCVMRASHFVKIIVACPHRLPKLPE
jgi:hypothetical protein